MPPQVASALAARHIGGAVNYVGVAETLGITASAQAAGLAADNLLCAVYFAFIYFLARTIPGDPAPGRLLVNAGGLYLGGLAAQARASLQGVWSILDCCTGGVAGAAQAAEPAALQRSSVCVDEGSIALALSCVVCYVGAQAAAALGTPDASESFAHDRVAEQGLRVAEWGGL